jgi:hypothetical protein
MRHFPPTEHADKDCRHLLDGKTRQEVAKAF